MVSRFAACLVLAASMGWGGTAREELTALRALTLTPAELLRVAQRVGSLEVGKDADVALYQGHPFYDVQARCLLTLVQGQGVHDGHSSRQD